MSDPRDSVNPARAAEAALYHERQAAKASPAAPSQEWFQLVKGNTVVKKTKTPQGVHTVYIGTRKECDARGIDYQK